MQVAAQISGLTSSYYDLALKTHGGPVLGTCGVAQALMDLGAPATSSRLVV